MRKIGVALCTGIMALGLCGIIPAQAQKKSVAEEILDILRANNQISDQQYRDLLSKARAEEEKVAAATEPKKVDPLAFKVYWKEGLNFDSSDGDFKLKIGGRIQNDWAIFSTDKEIRDQFGKIGDGTRFRRARINLEGSIYGNTSYKAEYDFASGTPTFTDVYIRVDKLPVIGSYTVGRFKEPFSLEELTSSRYITFLERSLPNVFSPSRNVGMGIRDTALDRRVTWALGTFRQTDGFGQGFGTDSEYNLTGRVTGLPWYEDRGKQMLHLGLSYSHKFRDGQTIRFQQRPETTFGPRFVDTDDIVTDGIDLINPEVAMVYGPFSLQGEWIQAIVDRPNAKNVDFDGWYIYGTYFLTGENRVYSTSSGAFSRVQPKRNFDGKGGLGAWEVGLRYSYLHLSDDDVRGGTLGDFTLGVNWYLNPNVAFKLNYTLANLQNSGEANIVAARFQVDF